LRLLGANPIVYVSPVEWYSLRQRPQVLMEWAQKRRPVFFFDPVGLRSLRPADWRRVMSRLSVFFYKKKARAPFPNLKIRSPIYFPFKWAHSLNRLFYRLETLRLQRTLIHMGSKAPILWLGAPSPLGRYLLQNLNSAFTIYDCMDDFPAFHKGLRHIEEDEAAIIKTVDVVFTASQALYDRVSSLGGQAKVHLIGNGVDFDFFATCKKPSRPPEDLPPHRPLLGYHGTISEWFDFELVRKMARKRPHWHIALIGPVLKKIPWASVPPNVHFLGRKPFDVLPAYLSFFDAAIIPFTQTPVALHANPIKAYEYLAMGLPVVSSPIAELLGYRHVLEIARDSSEFIASVERCLRNPGSREAVQERISVAREHSWANVFSKIESVLSALNQ
jgi:UDP-galactopyranose mutase